MSDRREGQSEPVQGKSKDGYRQPIGNYGCCNCQILQHGRKEEQQRALFRAVLAMMGYPILCDQFLLTLPTWLTPVMETEAVCSSKS
jgi:hypothetical protein